MTKDKTKQRPLRHAQNGVFGLPPSTLNFSITDSCRPLSAKRSLVRKMRGSINLGTQKRLPTNSFWECKEYQRTVKRVETANKLCSNLALLVAERAEFERAYAANLRTWSKHVSELSESEYGEGISDLWKSFCTEADTVANAHESIQDSLLTGVYAFIKDWRKQNFQKITIPSGLKQCRQLEHDFKEAQDPWASHLKAVNHAKKAYHQACQTERSLQVQVQNARTDPAGTPEQLKKLQDKLTKAEKEMERTKTAYETALNCLNEDKPRYLEQMTRVFTESQKMERKRLEFFKQAFEQICQALNVSKQNDFPMIYQKMSKRIADCDIETDLVWWSQHHGVDMPAVFPEFQEYSPELHNISSRRRTQTMETSGAVIVTAITSEPASSRTQVKRPTISDTTANGLKTDVVTPFDEPQHAVNEKTASDKSEPLGSPQTTAEGGDAADHGIAAATHDDGRPGIPVRALYAYAKQEEDEISLHAGEMFEKVEEADENGWCKGRKGDKIGYYPANYAEEYDATTVPSAP